MTPISLFFGVAALSGSLVVPASQPADALALAPARPVTRAVRLETRPDVVAAFGFNLTTFRREAAASLSRTASEHYGPITPDMVARLGRSVWFRPEDVDLYAVPTPRRADELSSSGGSVLAVPLHADVHADGSVAPPPPSTTGLVDPTFSSTWGEAEYIWAARFDVHYGGVGCGRTVGVIRGQWEYARLRNVLKFSRHDYWGLAQRSVAEMVRWTDKCRNAISSFETSMQARTRQSKALRQSPNSMREGKCATESVSVGGSWGGVSASITQMVEKCERWKVRGSVMSTATAWFGVLYDSNGQWNQLQRESASLEVVEVPRGKGPGLNTVLQLDVDCTGVL